MTARETCWDCSSPPLPDARRCRSCNDAHNERERERRRVRREAGLCVVCGDPAVRDAEGRFMSLCDEHRRAYEVKREQDKRRRNGEAVPTWPGLFARVSSSAQQETKQKPRRAKVKKRAKASKVLTRRSKKVLRGSRRA